MEGGAIEMGARISIKMKSLRVSNVNKKLLMCSYNASQEARLTEKSLNTEPDFNIEIVEK